MNKQRRAQINKAKIMLEEAKDKAQELRAILEEVNNMVDEANGEEGEYYENIPEGLKETDNATKSEAACEAMSDVVQAVTDLMDQLDDGAIEDLVSKLGTAVE